MKQNPLSVSCKSTLELQTPPRGPVAEDTSAAGWTSSRWLPGCAWDADSSLDLAEPGTKSWSQTAGREDEAAAGQLVAARSAAWHVPRIPWSSLPVPIACNAAHGAWQACHQPDVCQLLRQHGQHRAAPLAPDAGHSPSIATNKLRCHLSRRSHWKQPRLPGVAAEGTRCPACTGQRSPPSPAAWPAALLLPDAVPLSSCPSVPPSWGGETPGQSAAGCKQQLPWDVRALTTHCHLWWGKGRTECWMTSLRRLGK